MPGNLGTHLEQLRRAAPGGMIEEGPGIGGRRRVREARLPAGTISVAQMDQAKAAFLAAEARALPAGLEPNGAWSEMGPSRALYPFTELRNAFNYVPNEYVAAAAPPRSRSATSACRCDCRAYITPAGGGVWSTEDILATEPNW